MFSLFVLTCLVFNFVYSQVALKSKFRRRETFLAEEMLIFSADQGIREY